MLEVPYLNSIGMSWSSSNCNKSLSFPYLFYCLCFLEHWLNLMLNWSIHDSRRYRSLYLCYLAYELKILYEPCFCAMRITRFPGRRKFQGIFFLLLYLMLPYFQNTWSKSNLQLLMSKKYSYIPERALGTSHTFDPICQAVPITTS